ncbi:biotin/lipoyl-containing protein [Bacillus taeanensis]|uniref:Lipoyl-binding domain-containing protein n=1 Tax=Bacillus taeanensis TaxID=273032 RepID=A0A366XNF8_9BACI|nr:biotin/lipoyl-containing protein [Bacillus taeanensis]RBW67266.1 hypothetical protein DS031_23265 [Bacillus taeanensis]
MKQVIEALYSPCHGKVEEVYVKLGAYVYEWEKLFVIRTTEQIEEVSIGISGKISKLNIQKGDIVNPDMILAELEDDFVISGSD